MTQIRRLFFFIILIMGVFFLIIGYFHQSKQEEKPQSITLQEPVEGTERKDNEPKIQPETREEKYKKYRASKETAEAFLNAIGNYDGDHPYQGLEKVESLLMPEYVPVLRQELSDMPNVQSIHIQSIKKADLVLQEKAGVTWMFVCEVEINKKQDQWTETRIYNIDLKPEKNGWKVRYMQEGGEYD